MSLHTIVYTMMSPHSPVQPIFPSSSGPFPRLPSVVVVVVVSGSSPLRTGNSSSPGLTEPCRVSREKHLAHGTCRSHAHAPP